MRTKLLIGSSLILIGVLLVAQVLGRQVNAAIPEDCQYPQRPLVNGNCDNSDPCDPTTLKTPGLWGKCKPVQEPEKPFVIPEYDHEAK